MKGKVTDSLEKIVDFATITVLCGVDSSYVRGSISDENGRFKIENLPQGTYLLDITHLLYKRRYIPVKIQEDTELKSVIMEENVLELDGVTVTANIIQYKADRYIVSLQNHPITKGNNTSQVLALMPGVTNEENMLKINGQDVTQIYVNGRKLRDRNELNAIQADNIDKVEIIPMSGAEENASSMGGVIYIKLKKIDDGGYYGSASGNFSTLVEEGHMGDNLNASFNYRYGKLSIYNYTYYGHFRNFNKYDISTHYKEKDTFIDMKTDGKGWSTSFSDRLSLTYELNDKHSIGGNFRVGVKDGSPVNNTQSMIKNGREEQIDLSGSVITEKLRIREYRQLSIMTGE
ncbi:MAG: TonB-dependent receptor [Tannerellaceae bacterium]|nr:TonB-dependent receptor [Tannerellaceae bacterium]